MDHKLSASYAISKAYVVSIWRTLTYHIKTALVWASMLMFLIIPIQSDTYCTPYTSLLSSYLCDIIDKLVFARGLQNLGMPRYVCIFWGTYFIHT